MHLSLRPVMVLSSLSLCIVAMLGTAPAYSQPVQQHRAVYQFDIPQQPLPEALRAVARQTGLNVLFESKDLSGIVAPNLKAQLTAYEAIDRLLEGTGLSVTQSTPTTLLVRPASVRADTDNRQDGHPVDPQAAFGAVTALDAVMVFGTLEETLSIGSKSGQSLRETAKSVTVVTRERIEAQNLSSLSDVLGQATGISVESFSPVLNNYLSRGFAIQTIQRDGGAPGITSGFGAYLPSDTAFFEGVEVLRGVDGMYSGAGEPGGVVNLVRKRAKADPETQVSLSGGRWNYGRVEVDVTGPLTEGGRLRGRAVAAVQDNDYFYDRGESHKTLLYGTVEYDLTPSLLLIGGASYERRKEDGYYLGGPRYSNGASLDLPRSTSLSPDWSHWYFTTREYFVRAEQTFGNDSIVKFSATRSDQESMAKVINIYGAVDPVTLTGSNMFGSGYQPVSVQDMFDFSINGRFELFGQRHRYTLGTDYAKVDGGGASYHDLLGYEWPGKPVNVFGFDPSLYPEPDMQQFYYSDVYEQSQTGAYATLGLQLAKSLRLTLGGRYGKYRFREMSTEVSTRFRDSKFIPSTALSWDFATNWTAYASYAETFKVQADLLKAPLPGSPLEPLTGAGYELGIKGQVFGKLNASAALFRVERNGQGVEDPLYPQIPGADGSSCCFLAQADLVSEGIDLEVSGLVLPGWQLFTGYTYSRMQFEDDVGLDLQFNFNRTPRHLLKLWTVWNLPGAASRWTLNAGVVAQSSVTGQGVVLAAGNPTPVRYAFGQGGYAIWNTSAQYRLSDAWSVGLYLENLFDKTYYKMTNNDANRYHIYGTPRSYVLTFRGRW